MSYSLATLQSKIIIIVLVDWIQLQSGVYNKLALEKIQRVHFEWRSLIITPTSYFIVVFVFYKYCAQGQTNNVYLKMY